MSVAVVVAMLLSGLAVTSEKVGVSPFALSLTETNLAAGAVPGAPQNLVADQGPGFVWLWWDHPATNGDQLIKTYEIFRGTTSGGESLWDTILVGATHYSDPLTSNSLWLNGLNYYNDSAAAIGATYFYEIRAHSDAGNSTFSNEVTATPSLTGDAPNAPSATGTGMAYSAQLNWTSASVAGGSPPARFFYLYREDYLIPNTPITASFGAGGYLDEAGGLLGPLIGTNSNYTVRAANTYGQGQDTNLSLFIGGTGVTPSVPLNLMAGGLNNSVILSWERPVNPSKNGFDTYQIIRAPSDSGPNTLLANVSKASLFGYDGFYFDWAVTNGVTYYYGVKALDNGTGNSGPFTIPLQSATPHELPTPPFLVNTLTAYPGNGKVLLQWSGAFNATGYQIWRDSTSNSEVLLTTVGTSTSYFDNVVINGNTYYYKVKPVHLSTIGPFSPEANAAASTGSAPDAPLLVCTPGSYGPFLYCPPLPVTSPIIGWKVHRGDASGAESVVANFNMSVISFTSGFGSNDGATQIDRNYFYYVTVENMFGVSANSNEASSFGSPTGDVPDPATNIAANGLAGRIDVSWDSPTYEGTAILIHYELQRNDSLGGWTTIRYDITDLKGTTTYTDHSVIPGVTYHYRVLASNQYGDSSAFSPSASASASSAGTLPIAPQNLLASAGPGYVFLTWSAPANAGTPSFTAYDIYRSTTAGVYGAPIASVDEVTTTYNDTSVVAGTPYHYVVKAVNTVGSSLASNEVAGTPTAVPSAPSAPIGLVAKAGAGFNLLNWTAPTDAGNPSFTRYDIYRSTTSGDYGSPISNVLAGTLVFNDTTPIAGTPYFYVVHAVNTAGLSPSSNEVAATSTSGPQIPTAPQELDAVSGNNYVGLEWTAPANPGNPEFTRYDIFRGATLGSAVYLANVTTGTLTYNDTTAVIDNTYVYVVKAVNTVGASPASNSVTGSPGISPGPPTGFTATGHRNQITLNWTAPVGGGASNYFLYRGTTEGGEGTTPIATVTGITYQDDSVVAGTPYFYKVKANNSHGQSAFTEEKNATATPSTAPSAPLSLTATPGEDKVTLIWVAPADNGGSPVTGYQIWRSTGSSAAAQLATVGASTLTYVDTSGTEGTNYTYTVKAVNAIGASAQSNAQTAAPEKAAVADNTLLLVGIGVVVIIVIILLAVMLMRRARKPKSP